MKSILSIILILFSFAGSAQSSDTVLTMKLRADQFSSYIENGKTVYKLEEPEAKALQPIVVALENKAAETGQRVTQLENEVDALQNVPPPTATEVLIPREITASTYTITADDYNRDVVLINACTVTIPSELFRGFKCKVWRRGGEVTLAGNFVSFNKLKRIQQQFRYAEVLQDSRGFIVTGWLK